jgi:hypothetical protein
MLHCHQPVMTASLSFSVLTLQTHFLPDATLVRNGSLKGEGRIETPGSTAWIKTCRLGW